MELIVNPGPPEDPSFDEILEMDQETLYKYLADVNIQWRNASARKTIDEDVIARLQKQTDYIRVASIKNNDTLHGKESKEG